MIALDRRTLLIGGGAGIGLIVAFALWPREERSPLLTREGEQAFGAYLKIGTDGRVTVAIPQTETGQGAWTALPQIAADELGAAWESVAVEPAPLGADYSNSIAISEDWFGGLGMLDRWRLDDRARRLTARSSSIRAFEQPLREAAATARAMLIQAAAEQWGVNTAECDTADGFVIHDGRTLTFGALAEAAAEVEPPTNPPLRTKRGALAGRALPRLDLPAKSDGSFRFAGDVRLPDMLFAAVRMAPPGGRLTAFSRAAAERAQGVKAVVADNGWLAVIAETGWAAERGLRAANPNFQAPERIEGSALRQFCQDILETGDSETLFERGDYADAVDGMRPLAATYWVAPSAHLALEPVSAAARFNGNHLEVWAASQAPELAKAAAHRVAGAATKRITFYPMPAGDQGGRALEADAVPIAVSLARRLGRAVQVSLSATSSQNQDRPAPAALAVMAALADPDGALTAWRMRLAGADGFADALGRLAGNDAPGFGPGFGGRAAPPYAVPNVRIDAVPVPMPFAPGYMRGEPERTLTFFTESFIDEMARARGVEPLAYRMGMLGANPRLARCLSMAATAGGWDGGGRGSTMGLACASVYGSHISLLADASVGEGQRLEVHRLFAAVDCGRIANAGIVRQQIESGLLWALAQATVREPNIVGGIFQARPFGVMGLARLAGTPDIRVELVASSAGPGGVSGLGPAVLAPAVANAIYAGSGRRLRSLPFDLRAAA